MHFITRWMASCIRGSEGNQGNVSPRTLIRNPLMSSESRKRVYQFFEKCELPSATDQLRLWELCDTFLEHTKRKPPGSSSIDLQEANDLYQFIEEKEIDLDGVLKQKLRNAIDSGHIVNITAEVTNTKNATYDLLGPRLNKFTDDVK